MIILKVVTKAEPYITQINLNSNMIILKVFSFVNCIASISTFKFQYDNT